jgi:hypothetical protein
MGALLAFYRIGLAHGCAAGAGFTAFPAEHGRIRGIELTGEQSRAVVVAGYHQPGLNRCNGSQGIFLIHGVVRNPAA